MAIIRNIAIPDSTDNKPLRFFHEFPRHNSIVLAKEVFFPNLYDQQFRSDLVYNIDEENETFTVEGEEEVDFDERSLRPILEWQKKKYTFRHELEIFLRKKFIVSIRKLDMRIDKMNEAYTPKYWLRDRVNEIVTSTRLIKAKNEFSPYLSECIRPYLALLGHIYFNHSVLAPKADVEVKALLQESKYYTAYNEDISLSKKVVQDILNLRDKHTNTVFPFQDINSARESLTYFVTGEFERISTPIDFQSNVEAARYLIHEIAQLQGYSLIKVIRDGIFHEKGLPMKEGNFSTSSSRFRKRNSYVARRIDELIDKNSV